MQVCRYQLIYEDKAGIEEPFIFIAHPASGPQYRLIVLCIEPKEERDIATMISVSLYLLSSLERRVIHTFGSVIFKYRT